MFLLDCSTANNHHTKKCNDNISLEKWGCLKSSIITTENRRLDSIQLFNNVYERGCLERHADELFALSRSFFRFLDNAARNNKLPNTSSTQNSFHSNFGFLRESIVDFFNFIQETLKDYIRNNENYNLKNVIPTPDVKEQLFSFRLLVNKINCLPDFILNNCLSEYGNQCTLASFHIFHLYLELFWMQFVIAMQYRCIENSFSRENLLETEDFESERVYTNTDQNFEPEVEREIEWILYNLMSLSSKCYDAKGSKGIFSCSCVENMWHSLQISIDKLSNENKSAGFWKYYNTIVLKYVLQVEDINLNTKKKSCNVFDAMDNIKSNKPLEFSLTLLSRLANFYDKGFQEVPPPENVNSNFAILEAILKYIIKNDEGISEISMRDIMKQIIKISNVWTEPKSEIITLLWEYFHKRLNSAFSVIGQDISSSSLQTSFFNSSIAEIVSDLNLCLSTLDISKNCTRIENSFFLFITLLGTHLKNSIALRQTSYCQKIKVMAKATDDVIMCNKLQDLIVQLPFDNLPWNKKQILIKTHLIILYLYVENNRSISKVSIPVKSILNKYCSLRDSESMSLSKIALNGYLEILEISSEFQNDEHILLDSWISKYLNVCSLPDLYKVLEMFNNILSKLQILCSYQMNLNNSVLSLTNAFFQHILTTIKTLYSNGVSALQIGDLAFGFAKFVLENEVFSKQYESFQNLIKYFIDIESVNERVIRHYFSLILQDDQVLQSLSNSNKNCQSLLIHCWIKCAFISTEELADDDAHLMLLICQLEEFSSLNITPGYSDREQKNLCKFFYALNQSWINCQDANEKKIFRNRVNQYLNNVEKYVATFIKTPVSLQHSIQIFIALGSLFLHCSPIIYTRADPTCLLHRLVNTILLPHQLFMDKKHHNYVLSGICKSWYIFMTGLYKLDHKNDIYIEKVMRDMVVQYLPHFVEKTLNRDSPFNVTNSMIPNKYSSDFLLEKYILEKIASHFITCRGKQSHVHSTKALCIVHNLCLTNDINMLQIIVLNTLPSIFEQLMFCDNSNPNKRISEQIVNLICNSPCRNETVDIRYEVKEVLVKSCQKHLAFNSSSFFKLVTNVSPFLGVQLMETFLSLLKAEISKIENMRGVGFDLGLRNGIREIETHFKQNK
ncbi:protein MMS22-like [Arctopsyche grandis]|uniref:protein MMS22-like n=1 Tax=Arctopsyche grandis TaxID=121162 RepID=UPI00406D8A01